MALDVRLDPFLKVKSADPDAVVKSLPVEKVWSDEAREAAAEARRGDSDRDPFENDPERGTRQDTPGDARGESADRRVQGPKARPENPEADPEVNAAGQLVGWRDKKPKTQYPLGPGPGRTSGASTQTARQGMKDTLRAKSETFSPVSKAAPKSQRPPGPRVIEVAGDQGSIARDYDLLTPGQVTDKKEEGDCLFSPVEKVWSDDAEAAQSEAEEHGYDALVEKAWTDEARAAALEARRRGAAASGRERDERHWYGGDRDPSYRRRMDFVRTVEDKYGGAVADQASAILGVATHRDRFQGTHGFKAKEPLGEQNSNALRLISGHAHKLGLNKLGDKIDRYLGTTKAAKEGDCLFSPVEKVWSDEARAAAAEARRGRSGGRSPMRTGSQMESDAQRAGNRADDRDWARTQRENPRARPGYRPSDRAPKTPHTHAVMVDGGFDKTFPDAESAKAYAERLRSRSRSGIPSNRPTRATVTRIPRDLREKSAGPRVAGE